MAESIKRESLDDIAKQIEQEARMVAPGIQALFGFQLIAFFNARFADLSSTGQRIHLFALFMTTLSMLLLLTPASYHRIAEPSEISKRFCHLGTRCLTYSMAALSLAVSTDLFLISDLVLASKVEAFVLGSLAFVALASTWFVFPALERSRRAGRRAASEILLSLVLLVAISIPTGARAQPASAAPEPAPVVEVGESGDIARSSDKSVRVPQGKSDREIADRLRKICAITQWFDGLKVTSKDGVVTLEGKVSQATQRDWAVNLAQDADGVVAVINKIELKELGWFDLEPARKELKNFWHQSFKFIPHLVIGLLMLAVSIAVFRGLAGLNRRFWQNRLGNSILADVLSKVGALPVLLIGLYLFLQILGLTGLAFTVMGGTGALGLIAGFAFKNILENYFSGVMLSIRRPFIAGDVIEVAGYKGVVSKMTTRGTTLVNFDGDHILIPNSVVFTSVIKNQSASPLTRVHFSIEPRAGETPESLRAQVLRTIAERPEIAVDPKAEVSVEHRGSKTTVEAYFWINVRETSAEKLKSLLTLRLKEGQGGLPVESAQAISTQNDVADLLRVAQKAAPNEVTSRRERNLAVGLRSI